MLRMMKRLSRLVHYPRLREGDPTAMVRGGGVKGGSAFGGRGLGGMELALGLRNDGKAEGKSEVVCI